MDGIQHPHSQPHSHLNPKSLYLSWSVKRPCWASIVCIMVSKNLLSWIRHLKICNCFRAGSFSKPAWNCIFEMSGRQIRWHIKIMNAHDYMIIRSYDHVIIWSRDHYDHVDHKILWSYTGSMELWLPGLASGQCGHLKQMGKGISLQMSGSPWRDSSYPEHWWHLEDRSVIQQMLGRR